MQRLAHWLRFNWFYFGRLPWNTGISPPELIEFIHQHPPGRAIDLGCGTGTHLRIFLFAWLGGLLLLASCNLPISPAQVLPLTQTAVVTLTDTPGSALYQALKAH